jgi:hypothetical protein
MINFVLKSNQHKVIFVPLPGDFVICARTDARGVIGMDEAIDRAQKYVKSGADMIFPEGLKSREEFRLFAKAINGDETGRVWILSYYGLGFSTLFVKLVLDFIIFEVGFCYEKMCIIRKSNSQEYSCIF